MPWPQNLETARAVEAEIRTAGAVPATMAVIEGRLHAGLTADELGRAFARQTTIHAVLGYGGLAQRVVEEAARLKGLRVSDGATARRKGK